MEKKIGYILEIGYSTGTKLLNVIQNFEEIGYIIAVDEDGEKRIHKPQTQNSNWTATLVKVREVETWEEYQKKTKKFYISGTEACRKAKEQWKKRKEKKGEYR